MYFGNLTPGIHFNTVPPVLSQRQSNSAINECIKCNRMLDNDSNTHFHEHERISKQYHCVTQFYSNVQNVFLDLQNNTFVFLFYVFYIETHKSQMWNIHQNKPTYFKVISSICQEKMVTNTILELLPSSIVKLSEQT